MCDLVYERDHPDERVAPAGRSPTADERHVFVHPDRCSDRLADALRNRGVDRGDARVGVVDASTLAL